MNAHLGSTPEHPFWSETRQDFVEAAKLEIGEEVLVLNGQQTRLSDITPRAGPQTVYNFEVANQHVYYVGSAGLLVHNASYGVDLVLGVGKRLRGFKEFVGNLKSVKSAKRLVTDFGDSPFYTDARGLWGNLVDMMRNSDRIHFNLRGLSPKKFKRWVDSHGGAKNARGYQPNPPPMPTNVTNRELLEILSDSELMEKTIFYGGRIKDFLGF